MQSRAEPATAPDPVRFSRLLRDRGVDVPLSSVLMWNEALGALGAPEPSDIYWAGRASLIRTPEDADAYDVAFREFFLGIEGPDEPTELHSANRPTADRAADGTSEADVPELAEEAGVAVRWSRIEVLARRDIASCSAQERSELWALIDALGVDPPRRPSRRARRARRGAVDLRRSMRSSLRRGGEPVEPPRRSPGSRLREVVLLIDVSGSMEPYARALLRFAHAAAQSRRGVEIFTFATRLSRMTRELGRRDPDAALGAVAAGLQDLAGGTRLGEVLADFNDRFGVRGIARGADVVILSDGWDQGEPGRVAIEMGRLSRVAHRIVWVNPLKASDGYEPLAAGMAEALPFVDEFLEGHSVVSLRELATVLSDPGPR